MKCRIKSLNKSQRQKTFSKEISKEPLATSPVPQTLPDYEAKFHSTWNHCADLKQSCLRLAGGLCRIFWLNGIIDQHNMQDGILIPLTRNRDNIRSMTEAEQTLASGPVSHLCTMEEVHQSIANGHAVIYIDGFNKVLSVDVSSMPRRAVNISEREPTIEGPQEAFTESLETNLALIRKKLRSQSLKAESTSIGKLSHSEVCLLYVEGIVPAKLLMEVRARLNRIDIDAIVDTNYIYEMIQDTPFSIFPTTQKTERPDRTIAAVLEGRVAVLVQGAIQALLLPATFLQCINAAEDMYSNYWLTAAIRVVRNLMFWTSMLLPSLYVSLLSYQQDLIPTLLLIRLQDQHEGIPFPTAIEAFIMQFVFEIVREAGQRLPRAVGQSVSIVGTLVIGEAVVKADIVSAGMVIVVATTGIASFTLASYEFVNTTRVLQFGFLVLSGLFGLYGLMLGGILLVTHLVSLRSFGVPYMSPIAPTELKDMKDALLRVPYWGMNQRPSMFHLGNRLRNKTPKPSPKREK